MGFLTVVFGISLAADADVLITEVVDGNRIAANGDAGSSEDSDPFLTFVELTNTGVADVDLNTLFFMNLNNGATAAGFGSTALSGTLGAGQTYYLGYEADTGDSAFERTYGFAANYYFGSKFINGDDVLLLLDTAYVGGSGDLDANTIVDVYGVLGTDGTGQDWEYTDTVAMRNSGITSANSTFDINEWSVSDLDLFDDQNAEFHAANTTVVQPVPEPGSFAFIGLGMLGMFVRRRR